jgi:hypothetical protein
MLGGLCRSQQRGVNDFVIEANKLPIQCTIGEGEKQDILISVN